MYMYLLEVNGISFGASCVQGRFKRSRTASCAFAGLHQHCQHEFNHQHHYKNNYHCNIREDVGISISSCCRSNNNISNTARCNQTNDGGSCRQAELLLPHTPFHLQRPGFDSSPLNCVGWILYSQYRAAWVFLNWIRGLTCIEKPCLFCFILFILGMSFRGKIDFPWVLIQTQTHNS